ncbi:HAD family hydrolase [Costertonia aggregata]|uniref:HAD family phosphatase n=1 Tax=Costertonia aggregata TaxID=343403 RepID=A0A7H9AKL1_9FLAO|nr:HAD family phosphatase [Costertonia aggregata]QLG43864.1 HAD family phosphatase [Costertonia aggregata]
MIRNIIFDFGDVFINLDKAIIFKEIEKFGGTSKLSPKLQKANNLFEVGRMTTADFIDTLKAVYPKASKQEIKTIWNAMLLDFPDYRLRFLEELAKEEKYSLFLLSNTNALHIAHVRKIMGTKKYERFKNCFKRFYLSHEINMRKPNTNIYEFVLAQNKLKAEETLFIDDTSENTEAASTLGIHCWNIQVGKEDIIQLKTKL